MNRAAARFKNEALLRFSRGNLPRDPAAGLRTAFAVRKYAVKSAGEKEIFPQIKAETERACNVSLSHIVRFHVNVPT
ncbi:MAG: hypothetical protein IJU56_10380 [Clostridia bacterium]|nr:hypothetical protein [Clostridia bacterium]